MELNSRGGWIVPANTKIQHGATIPDNSTFGILCTFGDDCTFGDNCTIGDYCTLSDNCTLGDGCTLGGCCTLGDGCTLGDSCTLGDYCTLGDGCTLGDCCTLGIDYTLGDGCTLSNGCVWLGVQVQSWLTVSNVDGSGRQVKIVKHAEGVKVEAGCFMGTLEKFCEAAAAEGKQRYVAVITAIAGAM